MIRGAWLSAALAGTVVPIPAADTPALAPTVVHIALKPESEQRFPIVIPTETDMTVELDFPWPLSDWAGRGFTPEPGKYAGDFVVDAARGSTRLFVTPIVAEAHRVLHVLLSPEAGGTFGVPLEFIPAPPGLSWRKAEFAAYGLVSPSDSERGIRLSRQAPRSPYREPTPESRNGLIRTMRLLANLPPDMQRSVLAANPELQWSGSKGPARRSLREFTLTVRFALRDRVTDSLGVCVDVENSSGGRLLFDRQSWIVRTGDHAYAVGTVDFIGEVGPRTAQIAFLVLGRDPDGAPTRLLPENDFTVDVGLIPAAHRPPARQSPPEAPDG